MDLFFDDWGVGSNLLSGSSLDFLPSYSYGSMLPQTYQFDDWSVGSNYSSPSDTAGWSLGSLSPDYYGSRLSSLPAWANSAQVDLQALLPESWAKALNSPTAKTLMGYAPLAAGALSYFQQKPLYDAARKKSKADMEWEEEQRRRQRMKQAQADALGASDPNAVAAINSIASNRGAYTGYGAPVGYSVTGSGVQRQPFFAAEGGQPPEGYRTNLVRGGLQDFIRYLMNGKRFPNEMQDGEVVPTVMTGEAGRAEALLRGMDERRRRQIEEMERGGGPRSDYESGMYGPRGGQVSDYEGGMRRASGGALNLVRGATKGQADKIPAQLSDGEYVMDAEVVSALGDGNNEAGAAELDKMRENIRKHKRSGSTKKIPPKAKSTAAYLKGTK